MRRQSGLDRFVYSFQHRWETDRQFRATMSGAIGLLVILSLCGFVGLATGFTNVALAKFGKGGSTTTQSSNSQNTGTKAFDNPTAFPTNTVPPWVSPGQPVASPIGNSQTPAPTPDPSPTPTDTPTPPPCTSNCGGGGGGGSNGIVSTVSYTPIPWVAGQTASITVYSSENGATVAGVQMEFNITFPGSGFYTTGQVYTTDGSGHYTYTLTVPSGATAGQANIDVQSMFPDGRAEQHLFVTCAP